MQESEEHRNKILSLKDLVERNYSDKLEIRIEEPGKIATLILPDRPTGPRSDFIVNCRNGSKEFLFGEVGNLDIGRIVRYYLEKQLFWACYRRSDVSVYFDANRLLYLSPEEALDYFVTKFCCERKRRRIRCVQL